ncbi:MAG: dTDP-4-dehydrorhamnose 3,5-epimerase, partial [Ferruginibacter sp.]|nr:dTDP-4-dehydrorhamnose 3,5-epimerase [Chitinophagaceae bacterium]
LVFEPSVFEDERGYFFESYNEKIFQQEGIDIRWVQDNQSSSAYGVIRGLHYQLPPFQQSKLIRVLKGKILDVVVDIREGSPAYGKVFMQKLSAKNKKQLFIPAGLAHGFSVLGEKAEVLYKCDNLYNKESEAGILYNDPALDIDWGIPADDAIVSEKDKSLPVLAGCRNSFVFKS